MRVALRYGTERLELALPEGADLIQPPDPAPLDDASGAIRGALSQAGPLQELDPGADVAIVFSPRAPARLNALLAAELLAAVEGRGVPRERITLIMAHDLEFQPLDADPIAMLARGYRVLRHDPRDPDALLFQHRYEGERRGGVYLQEAFLGADFRIVSGLAAPHFAAGWTPALSVLPGLAAAHNTLRSFSVAGLLHPQARAGRGDGNPIHDEALSLARESGTDLGVWLATDAEDRLTDVFAGALEESVRAAEETLASRLQVEEGGRRDVVVCGSAGTSLASAVPALAGAAALIKQGGAIVLAAPCVDGLGGESFSRIVTQAATADALWERLLTPDFHAEDQWFALHLAAARRRAGTLHLLSSLDGASARAAHLAPSSSIETTLGELSASHHFLHGEMPRVGVVPDGARVVVPDGTRAVPAEGARESDA